MTPAQGKLIGNPEPLMLHVYGFNCQQTIGYVQSKVKENLLMNNYTAWPCLISAVGSGILPPCNRKLSGVVLELGHIRARFWPLAQPSLWDAILEVRIPSRRRVNSMYVWSLLQALGRISADGVRIQVFFVRSIDVLVNLRPRKGRNYILHTG